MDFAASYSREEREITSSVWHTWPLREKEKSPRKSPPRELQRWSTSASCASTECRRIRGHNVINVSFLKKYEKEKDDPPPTIRLPASEEVEYEVKKILNHRKIDKQAYYLI
mmetsp:Transcript_38778/g.76229  ORF Transcript_38778/g.76229 Transcript_38778/m.76229 type:complete len:111 (+) Transcript_38778:353-685(+)